MSFVIQRKSDGFFGRGKTRYDAEFIPNLQYARVFTEKGHATTSIRKTFATKGSRYARPSPEVLAEFEITEVSIALI